MKTRVYLIFLISFGLFACKNVSIEEINARKQVNPEPNIPLECYTDTGIVKKGKAEANPCYVCHTKANTPYVNELEDMGLTLVYSFPEDIVERGNPWLNAVNPDLTIGNIPKPSDSEIKNWIRSDNWFNAYNRRGTRELEYFPDVPPIYSYAGGNYSLKNIDTEGFILDPNTGERTGWRAFRWKPFPGFFPTNGRIDSTFIRLPENFRKKEGITDWEIYKKNLAILECAIKGKVPGEICQGTEVGDITVPTHYEGDAKNIPVITFQYPPGTEFAHPVYYLDPLNTLSFKSLRLREMRYMKKIAYAPVREGEEEEESTSFWDNGMVFNRSGFWLMVGFIEDEKGNLRPQSREEMKFCIGCHGGVGGTVDGTYTFWRKIPGILGWKDQDYNLSDTSIKDYSYYGISCDKISSLQVGEVIKKALQTHCNKYGYPPGEYLLYFALTKGGDHFRSNAEILSRISTDPTKISILERENIITNRSFINFLNPDGTVKASLFIPSEKRAYEINKQYYRVVKAQAFVFGRDLFGKPFGLSQGGNSIEKLKGLDYTGVFESALWVRLRTLLR